MEFDNSRLATSIHSLGLVHASYIGYSEKSLQSGKRESGRAFYLLGSIEQKEHSLFIKVDIKSMGAGTREPCGILCTRLAERAKASCSEALRQFVTRLL